MKEQKYFRNKVSSFEKKEGASADFEGPLSLKNVATLPNGTHYKTLSRFELCTSLTPPSLSLFSFLLHFNLLSFFISFSTEYDFVSLSMFDVTSVTRFGKNLKKVLDKFLRV